MKKFQIDLFMADIERAALGWLFFGGGGGGGEMHVQVVKPL